ncbi:hypothetical protein NMY22_g251 [Coprinellus aureogranulatus]|nr:hypothetical protein NMY22_g251 [Coprinellus aureogranulatus]
MQPLPRRTKLSLIAVLLCIILLSVYHSSTPTETRYQWRKPAAPIEPEALNFTPAEEVLPAPTRLCESEECFRGRWTPREKPYTSVEEVKPWKGCPSPRPVAAVGWDQEEADAKRLLDVINWSWTPDSGIMRDWNAEAFVVRLLRSAGGLIIVGDEMSDQYFSSVVVLLRQAGIILGLQDEEDRPHIHSYFLNPEDARAGSLISLAGVPASRTERPVVTLIENAFLVSLDELRGIANRVGATSDYISWSSPFPQADKWPAWVDVVSTPKKSDESSYPEDTILVMNTGTSWSRESLTLLKPRGRPVDEQNRITEAYRQMVRAISAQLSDIGRLSIFYRSTTPGHPNCGSRMVPYQNGRIAERYEDNVVWRLSKTAKTPAEKEKRLRKDWDLFSVHNDVWRAAILRLEQERLAWLVSPHVPEIKRRKGKAKWIYLDVWNEALQRPDAHFSPPGDCVQWCPPAIFDQWTMHLHHHLQQELEKRAE